MAALLAIAFAAPGNGGSYGHGGGHNGGGHNGGGHNDGGHNNGHNNHGHNNHGHNNHGHNNHGHGRLFFFCFKLNKVLKFIFLQENNCQSDQSTLPVSLWTSHCAQNKLLNMFIVLWLQ